MELETAKEILAEVLVSRPGVEEMIQSRFEEPLRMGWPSVWLKGNSGLEIFAAARLIRPLFLAYSSRSSSSSL
jgi:hypothetical protein